MATTAHPPHPSGRTRARAAGEIATLRALWAEQQAHAAYRGDDDPGLDYLRAHFAMELTLQRHLRAVDMIAPYIGGRVLEWGCRHGLDSCLYRMRLGESVELHGCDVCDGDAYRPFHAFSGLIYTRLHHAYQLGYASGSFDVVTSNGVLEHVPDDDASAREIFRVLRPGGTFAVTCLPNRYSYTEALQRLRGAACCHDRLYSIASASALIRAAGFEVVATRRFLMLPTMLNGFPTRAKAAYQRSHRLVWLASDLLERIWPVNLLASNLMIVARKPGAP